MRALCCDASIVVMPRPANTKLRKRARTENALIAGRVIPHVVAHGDRVDEQRAGRACTESSVGARLRIPAIVDHDGPGGSSVIVFESGAVLDRYPVRPGHDAAAPNAASRWRAPRRADRVAAVKTSTLRRLSLCLASAALACGSGTPEAQPPSADVVSPEDALVARAPAFVAELDADLRRLYVNAAVAAWANE